MSKEIPKKEGQKLNGVFPSIFALAFLLVGVPFASTYLVTGAIMFGGEPIVRGYNGDDILLGEYPYYVQSGDGTESKCANPFELGYFGANCTASLQQFGPTSLGGMAYYLAYRDSGNKWYQALPGCGNGTSNGIAYNAVDCGDSGFHIQQNVTSKMTQGRISPVIDFRIQGDLATVCESLKGGDSKVDYTIKFMHVKRQPILYGTNLWTYPVIYDEMVFEGTSEYDSVGDYEPGNSFCSPQLLVSHEMDFIEVRQFDEMLEEYFENTTDSFGIFFDIQLDNIRNDEGYLYDQIGWQNPFWGDNSSRIRMELDFVEYKVDPLNTIVRFGILAMGFGFWAIALASTPYWDPIIKKKGVKK